MEDKNEGPLPGKPVPRLTEEEREKLVLDMLQNQIYTVQHIDLDKVSIGSVFLIVGLTGIPFDPKTVGTIYAYVKDAGPLAVNDHPTFFTAHFVHVEDWNWTVDEYTKRAKTVGLIKDEDGE